MRKNQGLSRTAHLSGMDLRIENAKKQKIKTLQSLAKGPCFREGIWPIAGRKIFPTNGNLCGREVRHLARSAGIAFSPSLTYDTKHEVAQVSCAHIWRKRVYSCLMYEELLLLIRILESSLDREVRIFDLCGLAVEFSSFSHSLICLL